MSDYRARVRLGGETLEVAVARDGAVDPPAMSLLLAEAILADTEVDLTATGPTVELTSDDPFAIIAWMRDRFEIVSDTWPDDGWDDPRTRVPDDAIA